MAKCQINTVLNALREAIAGVAGIRDVRRELLLPNHAVRPAVGLVCDSFRREDRTWTADVIVLCLGASSRPGIDDAVLDWAAEIQAAIDTLIASGNAGGFIDQPRWDPWLVPGPAAPQCVGVLATIRVRCGDPVRTE